MLLTVGCKRGLLMGIAVLLLPACYGQKVPTAQATDSLFTMTEQGLQYVPDSKGNILPDFSQAGYKANNQPIPVVPVVHSISPVAGDNTAHIQQALDNVATLKKQGEFHGTLFLTAGVYPVEGTVLLPSGVVLRGEGQTETGTVIRATGTDKRSLLLAKAKPKISPDRAAGESITDSYVPVGARSFAVADASAFRVGQPVLIERPATPEWIAAIGMDKIAPRDDGRKINQWQPEDYTLKYERKITAIDNNQLTIDVPIVQMMDQKFGGGRVYPVTTSGRLSHIGVENLLLVSDYEKGKETSDESHAWTAIEYTGVENAWVSDVTAKHFGKSLVNVNYGSRLITVRDSTNLDPVSKITGGRRYSFGLGGAQTLFLRCNARGGRHDYITYSRVPGPNAFVYGVAEDTHNDIGPHMRYATGTLYDNISGGDMNTEDRGNRGSGHGWSGAQQVFWNTESVGTMAVQSPPEAINWSVGHIGKRVQGTFLEDRPQGEWISHGQHVPLESLFVQQLIDRIGEDRARGILER